jgi:hypothetical protein
LDEYATTAGIGRVDLLKVDVEGHELSVLRGGEQLLVGGRVNTIVLEENDAFGGEGWRDIAAYLGAMGYRRSVLPPLGLHRILGKRPNTYRNVSYEKASR